MYESSSYCLFNGGLCGVYDCKKDANRRRSFSLKVRDITKSEEYKKEVEKYGFLGVPVTVVGDHAVKGFNPEFIELIQSGKN